MRARRVAAAVAAVAAVTAVTAVTPMQTWLTSTPTSAMRTMPQTRAVPHRCRRSRFSS